MKIYGGRSGYNPVSFSGDRYQSISRYKVGKITTEVRLEKENRVTHILSKIPFVRSFSLILELMIDYWRRFILASIVLVLMELFIGKSNSQLIFTIPINTLEMLLVFLITAGIVIKTSQIGMYHAAEHKVATAYERKLSLTIENVKKQPRTHVDCGTNLAIAIIICYALLFWLFSDSFWVLLISWSFGYELWAGRPKLIWDFILLIGKAVQYLFFTSRPKRITFNCRY